MMKSKEKISFEVENRPKMAIILRTDIDISPKSFGLGTLLLIGLVFVRSSKQKKSRYTALNWFVLFLVCEARASKIN